MSMTDGPTAREIPTRFGTPPTVFTRVTDIANQLSSLEPPLAIPAHLHFVEQPLSDAQILEIFGPLPFHLPDVGPLESEWPSVGHRAADVIAKLKDRIRSSRPKAHPGPDQFCYLDSAAHVGQWLHELEFHLPNGPDRSAWAEEIGRLVHARDLFDRLKVVAYCAPSSLLLQNWTDTSVYSYVLEENHAHEIDEAVFADLQSQLQGRQTLPEVGRLERMTRRAFPREKLANIERKTQELDDQIREVEEEICVQWRGNPVEIARREDAAFLVLVGEAERVVGEVAKAKRIDLGSLARPQPSDLASFEAWKEKVLVQLGMARKE